MARSGVYVRPGNRGKLRRATGTKAKTFPIATLRRLTKAQSPTIRKRKRAQFALQAKRSRHL